MRTYTYLALGDSYTIGESVLLYKNFPYQVAQLLRKKGIPVTAPEIIARTGWTTGELITAINQHSFLPEYDFVSLLIGVNNQYRGLPSAEYEKEFEKLLEQAIAFAGKKSHHVFVLSIPDYGKTPFGQNLSPQKIEREISEFNHINKKLSDQHHTCYIDITMEGRTVEINPELVAADGLHPSEKEYTKWAEKLEKAMLENIEE